MPYALIGIVSIGAILGLMETPALAQKVTPIKMAIGWLPEGQFNFVFVAKEKGFFQKHGLDVTVDNLKGSGAALNGLAGGHYDAVIADMGMMIAGVGRGFDHISLAVIQHKSPAGVVALEGRGIEKPKDLEGKTYVTDHASGERVAWKAFVKMAGIDESKVKILFAEPRVWDAMLLEGKVDVRGSFYCAVAPGYWAKGIRFKQILFANYGVKMYSLSVVTRAETLGKRPEVMQAFTTAILEGLKYSYLHPEEGVAAHLKAVPDYRDTAENRTMIRHGLGCTAALGLVDTVKEKGLGWMEREVVESTIDLISTHVGLEKKPPADRVFTNRFAGAVKLTPDEWEQAMANHRKYILAE